MAQPQKDETLKYELTYANGGFNDGIELKPGKEGQVELKISLYGGGEAKIMKLKPLPPQLDKLIRAYEATATTGDQSSPEITDGLKTKLEEIKTNLSLEVIRILQEADKKIETAIKQVFKK